MKTYVHLSYVIIPLSLVFFALVPALCADSASPVKPPEVTYWHGGEQTIIEAANPQSAGIVEACSSVFQGCRSVLDEAVTDGTVVEWRRKGAVEIVWPTPRRFDLPSPISHSYGVTRLLVSLEPYEKRRSFTAVLAFFEGGADIFVTKSHEVEPLRKLLEAAAGGRPGVTSNDVERKVDDLVGNKDYGGAIEVCRQAIAATDDKAARSRYYFDLSNLYHLLNQIDEQIDSLRAAADESPDAAVRCDYMEALGKTLIRAKRYKDAREALEKVAGATGKDWQRESAEMNLLVIDDAEGTLQPKIASLEKQLAADASNAMLLRKLAAIYESIAKDIPKAVACNERLVAISPGNSLALAKLEFLYEQSGQTEKAIDAYGKLLAVDMAAFEKNLDRAADLAIKANKPEVAIGWAKAIASAKPGDAQAQAAFGRIAFRSGNYVVAGDSLARAEALAGDGDERDGLIIERIAVAEKAGDKATVEQHIRRLAKSTKSEDTRAKALILLVQFLRQEGRLKEMVTW